MLSLDIKSILNCCTILKQCYFDMFVKCMSYGTVNIKQNGC